MPPAENVRSGRKAHLQTSRDSGLWESAQRFWRKSYAGDYLGLALLLAGYLLVKYFGEPFYQQFLLSDTRIQHPHALVQRVGTFFLFFYASGIPLLTILIWTLLLRRDLHKAHVTVLGLATSILTTLFLTDVLKDAVGRPRPDLIDRCLPAVNAPEYGWVTKVVCTQQDMHTLNDGWRSFPSGHSSFSFSGLGFLAMFLASQTHALRPNASMTVVILCLVPLLCAALIAISRLEDYRHGPLDVLGGSLLGIAIAYFNFRRYYPSLLSKYCDEPYSPPTGSGSGRTSPGGGDYFSRMRDEEEIYLGDERLTPGEDIEVGSSRNGNR